MPLKFHYYLQSAGFYNIGMKILLTAIIKHYIMQVKRIFISGTNRGLGKSLVSILHKKHP